MISLDQIHSAIRTLGILLLITPILICGCAVPYQVEVTSNGSPKYQNIEIEYQTHSSREAFQSKESNQVQLINYNQEPVESSDPEQWTQSTLRIQYPHPEGKKGMVLATLTMSRASFKALHQLKSNENGESGHTKLKPVPKSKIPQIREEIWKYEFPRSQLDLFLTDISKSGFFDEQTRPNGEAHLSIHIDKGVESKKWTQEPRLEDFIKRIYEKGWLDCYYTGNVN